MQSDNAVTSNNGRWGGYDQVDIVATEDATTVEIIPEARTRFYTSATSYDSIPAKTPIILTMNRGETFKLHEYGLDEMPSLTGTRITSDKPVAVTVTEDMVGGDTSGDQIVPIPSLGTRYVVPRGYLTPGNISIYAPNAVERFYIIGAYNNTTVNIYASGSTPSATTQLNAGQAYRYTFPTAANAIYVEATEPVYIYQRTGSGEEGAALLPSVYASGQTQVSFFQVGNAAPFQKGFLLFRSGAQGSFTLSYGSTNVPLSLTPLDVPNVPDWKIARFDLPAVPTNGRIVTIRSSQSPFSFGYITGAYAGNNSYGYFTAFGNFELPDTTYMCGNSITLDGGYAMNYLWTYPGGVTTATTPSITVTEEGQYTLVMNQDPNVLVATTYVKKINAGTAAPASQFVCEGNAVTTLTVAGASEIAGAPFQWQSSADNLTWTNITGATSANYDPGVLSAPDGVTHSIYYRRGVISNYCAAYSNSVEIKVSPCAVIINPHLRSGVIY
jgi:hypothetical protein